MISEHSIINFLGQSPNWGLVDRGSLATGWHAVYHGRLRNYHVYLSVDEQWFYMQCPLLTAEIATECKTALFEYLLHANDQIFMAKFALVRPKAESSLDVVTLVAECSVDNLTASTFWLMTEALATYAEQYSREIQAIALDKNVASLLIDQMPGKNETKVEVW